MAYQIKVDNVRVSLKPSVVKTNKVPIYLQARLTTSTKLIGDVPINDIMEKEGEGTFVNTINETSGHTTQFIVPYDCKLDISLSTRTDAVVWASGNDAYIRLLRNSLIVAQDWFQGQNSSSSIYASMNVNCTVKVSAGDVISFPSFENRSGGDLDFTGQAVFLTIVEVN